MADLPSPGAEVLVGLAGAFSVRRRGAPIAGAELGSRKARMLLTLLAVQSPHVVPVGRIVEVLWPVAPPGRATENVATLVSRLRGALGNDVIVGGRSGYRLGRGPAVAVDLELAAALVEEADARLAAGEPGLALSTGRRALRWLEPGRALEDEVDADWAEPARARMTSLLSRVRRVLAHAALAAADRPLAVELAGALISADPYDEDAARVLMRAHVGLGESGRALAAYDALRRRLAEELGADPSAETRELHANVLQEKEFAGAGAGAGAEVEPRAASGLGGSGGLVGRAAELAGLRKRWDDAAAGRSSMVLLVGEAGIGKTSLSDQVVRLARATGGIVLPARCHETERSLFLQPIVEAIAVACRTLPPDAVIAAAAGHSATLAALVPEARSVLGDFPPDRRMPVDSERRRAFEAVTAFVGRLSDRAPVLLALDDLQLAGRSTVELLHYLAVHSVPSTSGSVLVVATVRREEGREVLDLLGDVTVTVEVGELSAAAVSELAATAGQGELAGEILHRTGGHTLFVVETLRGLAAGEVGVPSSLQEAVLARVRRLGPAVDTLLRAGSVLGATFDPMTAARLLGDALPDVLASGESALAARLLLPSGANYEFANDLMREVLYATTSEPTRVAYHRQAADLLTDHPEAVAAHATAAADWPRAARAWLLAAEQALQRSAAADAEILVDRCLEALDHLGDWEIRGRALMTRARARVARAAYAMAIDDLEEVAALARRIGDQRLEMTALRGLGGEAPAALGRPLEQATASIHLGLRIATSLGDRAMEADLLAWLAILASNGLRFDEAVDQGRRAVVAARASASDEALAAALDGRKTSVAYLGEIDELTTVLDELEPLLRRLDDPFRLQWALFETGFPAVAAGEWSRAAGCFEAALEEARRTGFHAYAPWYIAHLGWLERLQGRHDAALELGRRALDLNVERPHAWCGAAAAAQLGTTLLEVGARAEAIVVLRRGRAMAEQQGSESYLLRCLAPLAEATGSPAVLEEADALVTGIRAPAGSAWLAGDAAYAAVARAWLDHGEPQRAREVIAPMLAAAARLPWVGPLAEGSLIDGRAASALGLADEARVQLARAERVASAHGLVRVAAAARAEQRLGQAIAD